MGILQTSSQVVHEKGFFLVLHFEKLECMQWFREAVVSDICLPVSQIVLKNFIKICLITKECHEEILIKLVIVLKNSKSNWNTVYHYVHIFLKTS